MAGSAETLSNQMSSIRDDYPLQRWIHPSPSEDDLLRRSIPELKRVNRHPAPIDTARAPPPRGGPDHNILTSHTWGAMQMKNPSILLRREPEGGIPSPCHLRGDSSMKRWHGRLSGSTSSISWSIPSPRTSVTHGPESHQGPGEELLDPIFAGTLQPCGGGVVTVL